jgi:hypothetical protein
VPSRMSMRRMSTIFPSSTMGRSSPVAPSHAALPPQLSECHPARRPSAAATSRCASSGSVARDGRPLRRLTAHRPPCGPGGGAGAASCGSRSVPAGGACRARGCADRGWRAGARRLARAGERGCRPAPGLSRSPRRAVSRRFPPGASPRAGTREASRRPPPRRRAGCPSGPSAAKVRRRSAWRGDRRGRRGRRPTFLRRAIARAGGP